MSEGSQDQISWTSLGSAKPMHPLIAHAPIDHPAWLVRNTWEETKGVPFFFVFFKQITKSFCFTGLLQTVKPLLFNFQ